MYFYLSINVFLNIWYQPMGSRLWKGDRHSTHAYSPINYGTVTGSGVQISPNNAVYFSNRQANQMYKVVQINRHFLYTLL